MSESRRDRTMGHLKGLKLGAIRRMYDEVLDRNLKGRKGPEEFLGELLDQEVAARKVSALNNRIKKAKLPQVKDLDVFKFEESVIDESAVRRIYDGDFIKEHKNVVFMGGSGTGKTHLAISIGVNLIRQGYKIRFWNLVDLVNELEREKEQNKTGSLQRRMKCFSLIILDELGYLPFTDQGAQLLFHLMSSWYENLPVIITTNLEFKEWDSMFHNQKMTIALLDRLTHHCEIIETGMESYRLKTRQQESSGKEKAVSKSLQKA
ncbi:MAG: IS21-like element helper ATPase IstB [Elusimicrobia bacterium]|nr:IS21-like element helper ATPase IstB [Candidatus Liberimonas magnetica]